MISKHILGSVKFDQLYFFKKKRKKIGSIVSLQSESRWPGVVVRSATHRQRQEAAIASYHIIHIPSSDPVIQMSSECLVLPKHRTFARAANCHPSWQPALSRRVSCPVPTARRRAVAVATCDACARRGGAGGSAARSRTRLTLALLPATTGSQFTLTY